MTKKFQLSYETVKHSIPKCLREIHESSPYCTIYGQYSEVLDLRLLSSRHANTVVTSLAFSLQYTFFTNRRIENDHFSDSEFLFQPQSFLVSLFQFMLSRLILVKT